jgi:hypothetical protein
MQQKNFVACKSKRHLSSCQMKNPKKKKVPRKQQTTLPFIPSGATENLKFSVSRSEPKIYLAESNNRFKEVTVHRE